MGIYPQCVSQNWLITPAALAKGQNPPANIYEQQWLLVLSGIASANLKGNSGAAWLTETITIIPDMAGPPPTNSGPLNWAISHYSIPKPASSISYSTAFALDGWAPSASIGSVFNQDQSINSGFSVNGWRPTPFSSGDDVMTPRKVNKIFSGINADIAVRDSDAWLYNVNYNITAYFGPT
jgi:hypothetical protein